ncbi:hypothetical protein DID80_01225 [Candidatus Marinamargulisbacteria bacterium SCGC AAA071-K20]|nr:hypothetical protein DID80_01225 [Candidatus Marinamargulisbacteria bacterium SCGC AAA071-K20]
MKVLIQIVKSHLVKNSGAIIGANKIGRILQTLLIQKYNHDDIIVVSDGDKADFDVYLKDIGCENNPIHFTSYSALEELLDSTGIVPDIGFHANLQINALLEFRNYKKLNMPVVGLIHSLGNRGTFRDLEGVQSLMGESDMLICPSTSTQDTTVKLGLSKSNSTVIPYGIEIDKYSPVSTEEKLNLRKSNKVDPNRTVILMLSRITPFLKMDLVPVIRLLPYLVEKHPDLLLLIVGCIHEPFYVEQVKDLIKNLNLKKHVQWIDQPDQNQIPSYYQLSDIFLSLSDFSGETFGLTVAEAQASGLPVVISNYSGYKNHFTDGVEGYYISTITGKVNLDDAFYSHSQTNFGDHYTQSIAMDMPVLHDRLDTLLKSNSKREEMGKRARQQAETRYQLPDMIEKYHNCFEDCMASSKNGKTRIPDTKYKNISPLLSHFVSDPLKTETTFTLSAYGKDVLQGEQDFISFEDHQKRYTLLRDIFLHLHNNELTISELATLIQVPEKDITKNILYMLKQYLIISNNLFKDTTIESKI